MTETIIGFLSTALLSFVGWTLAKGSSLDSRITVIETQQETLEETIQATHDSLKELLEAHFDGMDKRLARIERSMNGHLAKD
jgi:hypothetical protein